jgi:hypothetical protein
MSLRSTKIQSQVPQTAVPPADRQAARCRVEEGMCSGVAPGNPHCDAYTVAGVNGSSVECRHNKDSAHIFQHLPTCFDDVIDLVRFGSARAP